MYAVVVSLYLDNWVYMVDPRVVSQYHDRSSKGKKEAQVASITISTKYQIVIPKEIREKLHLSPKQRLQVLEKGGVISLVPEVPLKSLKGILKGMNKADVREKKDRL